MKHSWAPQWADIVHRITEEYVIGRWVDVLVNDYSIDPESAESLKACVVKDFAQGGSVSGSGPLGC